MHKIASCLGKQRRVEIWRRIKTHKTVKQQSKQAASKEQRRNDTPVNTVTCCCYQPRDGATGWFRNRSDLHVQATVGHTETLALNSRNHGQNPLR